MNLQKQIIIPRQLWHEMYSQVETSAPFEACGLVAGQDNQAEVIYPIRNMLKSPVRFLMEPQEQLSALESIEENGLELLAIYHSHPTGPEIPSETDLKEARYEVASLIWSPHSNTWQVRAFWLDTGKTIEIQILIRDM